VFGATFEPASLAAVPNLVDERDLSTANALSGSLWGTMLAIGGALGGVVAGVFGRDAAIVVDAASFVISAAFLVRIRGSFAEERRTHERHPGFREDTLETLRFARKEHRVLALLAVKFGWGVAGGVLVLLPLLAIGSYDAGEFGLGMLMMARGIGALIGPFVGRARVGPQDRRLFGVVGAALAVFGIGYAMLGLAPGLLFAMGAVLVAHVGGGAQWTLSSYGLQRIVPDRIRGRIFAFDFMLVTLTFGLSSVLTGTLADTLGPRVTAVLMGSLAVGWSLAWTWLTTDVRRRTRLEG
jgi:MFS family permease